MMIAKDVAKGHSEFFFSLKICQPNGAKDLR